MDQTGKSHMYYKILLLLVNLIYISENKEDSRCKVLSVWLGNFVSRSSWSEK